MCGGGERGSFFYLQKTLHWNPDYKKIHNRYLKLETAAPLFSIINLMIRAGQKNIFPPPPPKKKRIVRILIVHWDKAKTFRCFPWRKKNNKQPKNKKP